MSAVTFRPEAEADLIAIALHIAQHDVGRARKVIARLKAWTDILEEHPFAGRPRDELGAGLRSLAERPYILIYRLIDDAPEIVAILHGVRDLPAALANRIAHET